jgi:hypothetical protein
MCLQVSYKKKYKEKLFFGIGLKSLKKGVGSGSISHVTDPQHWLVGFDKCKHLERFWKLLIKVCTSRYIQS